MSIDINILNRKGARKAEDIPKQVIQLLNSGRIETCNLTEWLAVDQLKVLKTVLKTLKKEKWLAQFETAISAQKKPTANSNTRVIGENFAELTDDEKVYDYLKTHESDIVRCWACWALASKESKVKKLATVIKPFAADRHFGVREVVIFASKEKFASDLENAISILSKWTKSKDENIRRFVAECLRPIGVWTKKIPALADQPTLGISLIEPLKSDESKYVQNSVANWLNDASKSQPAWVKKVCSDWEKKSDSKATAYIVKRGMRTINK